MNAEQLHTVASLVISDVESAKIIKSLNNLLNHLNDLQGNPGDSGMQQQVSNSKTDLFNRLDVFEQNIWPTGIQQIVEELGGTILVDPDLKTKIQNILTQESMTPSSAHQQIEQIRNQITEFVEKLKTLKNSFEALNIKEEELAEGEVELGVLIPRDAVNNKVDYLAKEIIQIDKILKLFSSVAIGTREDFDLLYISSSDPKIFIRPNAKTATLVSATVTFILASLNQLADLKIKYEQIKESGIEDKYTKQLEKGIEDKIKKDFDSFRTELLEKYGNDNSVNKNEDETQLKIAIDHLAYRLENGYSVEVRVKPLPAPAETDIAEDQESDEAQRERQLLDDLVSYSQQLGRVDFIGQPVLSLPKPEELDVADSEQEEQKR